MRVQATQTAPAQATGGRIERGAEPDGMRGMLWLARREILRFSKVYTQTILAPVVSSALFILVFGLSLSGRIRGIDGIPYDQFIVPGLVAMSMVQAAYSNNSATIFQARFDRYIHDVLSAPMRPWQMTIGFLVGGVCRALLIGALLVAVAAPLTGVGVAHPLVLAAACALGLLAFSALGLIAGIYAQSWDHTAFIQNIVIAPLAFVGGTFYSVSVLPSPWQEISHVNPLFFLINAFRYGFLGHSDVSVALSLAICAALALPLYAWAQWLFASGRKLKA